MRFTEVLAASLVAPLVAAHGGVEGAPKIFGMPKHLRARNPWTGHKEAARPALHARQGGNAAGMCGTQGGGASCAAGFCCSAEGYCGNTKDHCAAPDCQINYGPACDSNQTPAGATTRNDARPQLGSVAYGGTGIYSCLKPNTVAITYDDGPYIYTEQVLAQFAQYNAKATFFVSGNNNGKGAIDENWAQVIKDMVAQGHQVASHTWGHQDLSAITHEQRIDQMVKNEMAIRNILGKYPTYMRPPYSSCTAESGCEADLAALGYVVTYFDLDTDDYNQLTPEHIQIAKDNFKAGIDGLSTSANKDKLSIAHDIHELTALNLTGYMLEYVYSKGLTSVTVGECLNDPPENWYRSSTPAPPRSSTSSSSVPAPTPTGATSTDGSCGSLGKGQSCIGFIGVDGLLNECCSQYGWCGNSAAHCGDGCLPGSGKCGNAGLISSSAASTKPTSTPASSKASSSAKAASSTPASTKAASSTRSSSKASSSSVHASSSAASVSVHASSSVHLSSSASRVSSAPHPTISTSGETSRDGTCGGFKGYTCAGFKTLEGESAECCSEFGWCGASAEHCGATCNPIYGKCTSSAASSSAPVSQKSEKHDSTSAHASATGGYPASTPVTVSKDNYPTGHVSDKYPASTPIYPSGGNSAVYPSSSAGYPSASSPAYPTGKYPGGDHDGHDHDGNGHDGHDHDGNGHNGHDHDGHDHDHDGNGHDGHDHDDHDYPGHNYPGDKPSKTPVSPASSTPCKTSGHAASSTPVYPASSPVYSASTPVYPASTPIYKASSFSTVVKKPSSTPCSTTPAAPTPTPKVSKDGKCGEANGGQTCVGYKNPFGAELSCCCKESGKCSNDPWACGVGCDKPYGKCNNTY